MEIDRKNHEVERHRGREDNSNDGKEVILNGQRQKRKEKNGDSNDNNDRDNEQPPSSAKPKAYGLKDDNRKSSKAGSRRRRHNSSTSSDEEIICGRRRRSRRRDRSRRKRRRSYSSGSSSVDESTSSAVSSTSGGKKAKKEKKNNRVVHIVANARLLEKLSARGETLEEREQRRAQRRAERIASHFGYTPEENPFNDPNLHETFKWKKREEKQQKNPSSLTPATQKINSRKDEQDRIFHEIEAVRKRREDRELAQDEMERIKADEARMREMTHYDEWAKKEEEFHLQQQRQRSAIRLIEHREQPIDVLAKNLLLFALDEEDKRNRAKVKYQERFDALNELENSLEAELLEPHVLLKDLKLDELEELAVEVETFRDLEKEAMLANSNDSKNKSTSEMIITYWDNLLLVCRDEISLIKAEEGNWGVVGDIVNLFEGKSTDALNLMKQEILRKTEAAMNDPVAAAVFDNGYWKNVLLQLQIYQAKEQLSDIHNVMLARQLEKLERRKEELSTRLQEFRKEDEENASASKGIVRLDAMGETIAISSKLPEGIASDFGNLDEQLGLADEVGLGPQAYAWQDKYRPRKPRYFNRVKTGYDWNKYNQTHYDHDNPPPKIVQGYKFNIFYPDLIDKTQTAQYVIEPADTDEFCVIRFHAGPPYEDIAFKIINREWHRSRRRGFRCTFERGVLSLYFNFNSHWYRR